MKIINKIIVSFMMLASLLVLNPIESKAGYKDNSGNLPGTVSDGTITALAGVAVVGLGVLTYVLIKKHKNKTASTQIKSMREHQASVENVMDNSLNFSRKLSGHELIFSKKKTFLQDMEAASQTIPVDLTISPLSCNSCISFERTNGVQVGIKVKF